MSALSNNQKAILAQLARRAFNLIGSRLRGADRYPQSGTLQGDLDILALRGTPKSFEEWRHAQVRMAVGKEGLRCCSQMDYKRVEAHFQHLLGNDGAALNAHMRAESEPRRQAEAVLIEACKRKGLHLNYAAALCQRIHHVNLFEAPANVLWKLVYTINNRKARKMEVA
jgi:hypothetical protein